MSLVDTPEMSRQQQQQPSRRQESSSLLEGSWQEHFVDIPKASLTADVGSAVAQSLSYVIFPNFGSAEERLTLQDAALHKQQEDERHDDISHHIMAASHVNFNCTRYSVERLLDAPSQAVSAVFLDRLLRLIQNDEGLSQMFAHRNFTVPLCELKATWYAEPDDRGVLHPEPKVNIYQEGGYFKQHTDGMQLTLLVVLNDSFEGGGTAFYSEQEDDENANEREINIAEAAFDKWSSPPAGTAIVWGAELLHMALPVTKGMRAVYVGSFDLNEEDSTIN